MQYNWKLFKWNKNNSKTELTEYLTAPIFLERRCNERLSTGEVILDRMPTSEYLQQFPPKSKFTLEKWIGEALVNYYDYMVERDDVEQYAGLPEINCHRVKLIEPSVYAQGVHCDNFSLTYEQNDSTLNYKTVISSVAKTVPKHGGISGSGYARPEGANWYYGGATDPVVDVIGWCYGVKGNFTQNYNNSFLYKWQGIDAIKDFMSNLNGLVEHNIAFTMPIVECIAHNGENFADRLFDCPTRCTVTRTTLKSGIAVSGSATTIVSQLYNPINIQNRNDRIMYNAGGFAGLRGTQEVDYDEKRDSTTGHGTDNYVIKVFRENEITSFPAMINTNDTSHTSREISFTTTPLKAQDIAEKLSYEYTVSLQIEPYQQGALVAQYEAIETTTFIPKDWPWNADYQNYNVSVSVIQPAPSSCYATTSFQCRNMLEDAPSKPFLIKGEKYNCYDLFRKAMLTCDTHIFDNKITGLDEKYIKQDGKTVPDQNNIQYPIIIDDSGDPDWMERVKKAIMFESVFEGKNLWEVMQQIGHYLHAMPQLEFARDGTDRFVLTFKQLGGTVYGAEGSTKITVFNSQTLDNFFTQYDSYVTNLFSPQNEVDEWLVCKTSDSSYLVSNNTAELHTKYGITELVQFDITYGEKTEPALEFVFEKSVYDTLSARTDFVPAKWAALYFQMGTSKILGLNYVPPTPKNDGYMALKTIVGRLFNNGVTDSELKFNDLKFHIRYKTQDNLRITQFRPDLERFMKNSQYETYPHHEQYYNQQDKIVDSERFSQNLFGKLIRVANSIYQCQEYARPGEEKNPGELFAIDGESYYATECENEYYSDAIFQKISYSKNFNQLANIVTIPSEPRFFEVSERSMIRREIRMLDFIRLTSKQNLCPPAPRYINVGRWHYFIRDLLFCDNGNPTLPNFAYTNFKADTLRQHPNLPDNNTGVMFPSSEAKIVDGAVQPMPSEPNKAVIVPLLHFPLRNAIVFEWDMEDNFKAADSIDTSVKGNISIADKAYYSMQPVRYCDVYGRADLFDFQLFYRKNWSPEQVRRLPFAEVGDYAPNENESLVLIPKKLSIGLDKDNREALSFNYQLNLLHEPHDNDAEDFVIYSNLFGEKNKRLKAALLNIEVSTFNETVAINVKTIVADDIDYTFTNQINGLQIEFAVAAGVDISKVKSIVLFDTIKNDRYAYIAKNVAKLPNERKLQNWYIYPTYNN